MANVSQTTFEFPFEHASLDNSIQNEECKGVMPNKSAHESECLEDNPVKFAHGTVKDSELNEEESGFGNFGSDVGGVLSVDLSEQQIVHCDDTISDNNLLSSTSVNLFVDKNSDEQNGTTRGQVEPENTDTFSVAAGQDNGSVKYSNGFAVTEGIHSEDGLCDSGQPCDKFSAPLKPHDQIDGMVPMKEGATRKGNQPNGCELVGDIHFSPGKDTSHSADCGLVCSYICCSGCLYMLHRMIQKILLHKWELQDSYWKPDDVHDVVLSLLVDLLSAVRKVDVTSNSIYENLSCGNPERLSECSELLNCHCQSSGNSLALATECGCHSMGGYVAAKASGSANSQFGSELEFIFRDGILVPVDSNRDVTLHCKYEKLCLCSIIKSVTMMT